MSALTVYNGLATVLSGISGLQAVILGEPTSVQITPAIYTMYQSFERPLRNNPPARNMYGMAHVFALRLVILWQDNPEAERQLLTLLDTIPDAIDANPQFSGAITKGVAYITSGITGFARIGDTLYRIVDYSLTALEKRNA